MTTPDERYELQKARDALAETETALSRALLSTRAQIRRIDRLLDLGPNPYLPEPPEVLAEQMKAAADMGPVCICDLGWDPECPRHRDPDARYVEDHQSKRPASADTWTPRTPQDLRDILDRHDRLVGNKPPTPLDLFGRKGLDH